MDKKESPMEITLADERALVLIEQLTIDQAEGRAWSNKLDAFGSLIKLTKFLQRPKDEDFELVYREHRYQPFWHVVCSARYVYERQRQYPLLLSGPEAQFISIEGREYPATGGKVTLTGTEHCQEEPRKEVYVEGYTGEEKPTLAGYIHHPANEIPVEHLDNFKPEGVVVVPPQARASAIVRDTLIGVIKSIKADRILEDHVAVERVDLYYRPVYAFQYRWISKEKEAVLEYDAVTGKIEAGGKTFQQYMGKFLDPDFLFDVGIDTVDLFVPGGGLAVKLAKKGIDAARNRKN
jgi:hypothetical protein